MNNGRLLPVLRNLSNDILSQAGVLRGVAPGLAVFLAEVSPTLQGTMGMARQLREKTRTDESSGAIDLDPVCLILRENGFEHVGLRAQ